MKRRVVPADMAAAGTLTASAISFFLLPWIKGRVFFWGDLTYIHYPWRSLVAEQICRGMVPLWNPYCYFGMPLAAQMQSAAWYPGSLPFYFFGFENAVRIYHVLNVVLAGLFAYLALRRLSVERLPSVGGGVAYMLGGWMISRVPFLNHIPVIALFPALVLFSDSPVLLGIAAALSFLSGYPTMLGGQLGVVVAGVVAVDLYRAVVVSEQDRWGNMRRALARRLRILSIAGALALGTSCCLLMPALELARTCRRAGGIDARESLTWSYRPQDFAQFISPILISAGEYSPAVHWWKTSYAGLAAFMFAVAGLASIPAWAAAGVVVYLLGVAALLLGGNFWFSRWLWASFAPLRYVRYPGNMAYLAAPAFAAMTACGLWTLQRKARPKATFLGLLAICAELIFFAHGSQPTVQAGYFTSAGPLAAALTRELGGSRYLLSPLALHASRGRGDTPESASLDFRQRLYGLTNAPSHLFSAANFGEPLVPQLTYRWMDFLLSQPGLAAASPWLAWADISVVLTRDHLPAPEGFSYAGELLWHGYRRKGFRGRALWMDEVDGDRIPSDLSKPPSAAHAVSVQFERPREDRFMVSGTSARPGWLYVAEPAAAGWRVFLNDRPCAPAPALLAFQKIKTPSGNWRASFRYDPTSWRVGSFITVLFLCALAGYCYNRSRRLLSS